MNKSIVCIVFLLLFNSGCTSKSKLVDENNRLKTNKQFIYKGLSYQILSAEEEELAEIRSTKLRFEVKPELSSISWERGVFFFKHYYQITSDLCYKCDSLEIDTGKIKYHLTKKMINKKLIFQVKAEPLKGNDFKQPVQVANLAAKNLARFIQKGLLNQNLVR